VRKALLVVSLCAAVVLQAAKITTKAEADPEFSFAGVRTWAWTESGTGDVFMARSSQDDPVAMKQRVDPIVTAAIARELEARGLTRGTAGSTDVTVHYYVLVTVGSDAQVMGQFLPAVPLWGVPPFSASTSSLNVISRGSLVLDVTSTSLKRVVWRGVSQTDLDMATSDAKREAIVRDAAHELVKRLPLKGKK
jgi:hypothetical protein